MAASADQPQNRHNHLYLQYVTPIPAERGLLTLASSCKKSHFFGQNGGLFGQESADFGRKTAVKKGACPKCARIQVAQITYFDRPQRTAAAVSKLAGDEDSLAGVGWE